MDIIIIMRSIRFIPISCIIMSDHDSGIDEACIGPPLNNQVYQWCMLGLGLYNYQHYYDGSPYSPQTDCFILYQENNNVGSLLYKYHVV